MLIAGMRQKWNAGDAGEGGGIMLKLLKIFVIEIDPQAAPAVERHLEVAVVEAVVSGRRADRCFHAAVDLGEVGCDDDGIVAVTQQVQLKGRQAEQLTDVNLGSVECRAGI